MEFLKRDIYSKLGDRLMLWIDPRTVVFFVASSKNPVAVKKLKRFKSIPKVPFIWFRLYRYFQAYLKEREPFIIPAHYYGDLKPIEQVEKYQKVRNLLMNRSNLKETIWYQRLIKNIHSKGYASHKNIIMKNEMDVNIFFRDYIFKIVDSMKSKGYCMDKGWDLGTALIGRDGKLHKSGSGTHRFYIARHLGISKFPVKIAGIHEEWFTKQKNNYGNFELEQLAEALREIERKHQKDEYLVS